MEQFVSRNPLLSVFNFIKLQFLSNLSFTSKFNHGQWRVGYSSSFLSLWTKLYDVTIQVKPLEQYFYMVLLGFFSYFTFWLSLGVKPIGKFHESQSMKIPSTTTNTVSRRHSKSIKTERTFSFWLENNFRMLEINTLHKDFSIFSLSCVI